MPLWHHSLCNVLWDIWLYALIELHRTGLRRTGEDRPMGKKHCREDEDDIHQHKCNWVYKLIKEIRRITHSRVLKQKCGGHWVSRAGLQRAGQQARGVGSTFLIQKHLFQRSLTPPQSGYSTRL